MIKSYVDLEFQIEHKKFKEQFYVTGLGKQKIILGFPWLHKHNPIIDWKKWEIKWQPLKIDWRALVEKGKQIRRAQQPKVEEVVDEEEILNRTTNRLETEEKETILTELEETTYINKIHVVTKLAIKENCKKEQKTDKQMVPEEFLDIFSKEKAHRFPKTWPWDHKIEEGFTLPHIVWPDMTGQHHSQNPNFLVNFSVIFRSLSGHCLVIVRSFSGSFSDQTICPPDFLAGQSSGHDQKDQ